MSLDNIKGKNIYIFLRIIFSKVIDFGIAALEWVLNIDRQSQLGCKVIWIASSNVEHLLL